MGRTMGRRSVLVGTLGRDFGKTISSDDAEVELYSIHDFESYFPDAYIKIYVDKIMQ